MLANALHWLRSRARPVSVLARRAATVFPSETTSEAVSVARILLGVSGGIAAYKAVELVRLATKAGHAVRVVQTRDSLEFVGRATFEGITGAPVLVDEFERDPARGAFPGDPAPGHDPISHLELVSRADVFCVAPASANTLAKLAHGLADNLLTSAALASVAPLVLAPAMNNRMWEHPATRANLDTLRGRGAQVVGPGTGSLASKDESGVGRLAEPAEILAAIEATLTVGGPLDGLRVLVTAGGTREPIDSVRYVGNRSSGRMGLALAEEAARRGAEVTLVAANLTLPAPAGVSVVAVETAAELLESTRTAFADADVLLMAAAVADFRPGAAVDDKLTKTGRDELVLRLEPTEDVLATLAGERTDGQTVVGFAAEHGAGAVERGRDKLQRKGLDAVVVNDISRTDIGFDSADNEVTIVTATAERNVPLASKETVAAAILDEVEGLRAGIGTVKDKT
jgi:phosphopantothenoylcysteine decarboxylase / phosphopantothenate---cysteine ligase